MLKDNIITRLFSSYKWGLSLLAVLMGILIGIGAFTFYYAKGFSYFTDNPSACANCHIMEDHYQGWYRSSHHSAAVCNDCHTPEDLFGKYWTKAINGYHHSRAFTFGDFIEPIQITERNKIITEQACRKCHSDMVLAIDYLHFEDISFSCLKCHKSVGHLE